VLDNLEELFTREELEMFLSTFSDVKVDEYHVFNALAKAIDDKLLADISYLRLEIVEKSGNEERTTFDVLSQIFRNKQERNTIF
jgi:hypothetical protein